MKMLRALLSLTTVLYLTLFSGPATSLAQNTSPSSFIYEDALSSGWEEYLWDTISANYNNSDPVASGKYSMAITPGRGWTAWHAWIEAGFDLSPYGYLTFQARSSAPDTWWEIQFLDQKLNRINNKTFLFSPQTDSWQTYTVDLQEHGVGRQKIYAVRFWYVTNDIPTSTLFVDDLEFGGVAPTPPPTLAPQTINYTFTVDAATEVNPFHRQMRGVALANWEHSWGKYFAGDVPGLAGIFRSANIGLIRYAGGLWSNFVMWERSPQKTPYGTYNPNRANYHPDFSSKIDTRNEYNFHYGIDEIDSLAKLARETGSDVLIQVNISKNDPYMWADLVHYANIEKHYGFQYWELGNEIDHECQQGNTGSCMTKEVYQTRAASYISAMKAVDPTITIVGGVPAAAHDIVANNWVDTPEMSRYLFAGQTAGADALSYHWYTDCNLTSLNNVFAWKYGEPDTSWRHMYSRYWSYLGPYRVQNEVIQPSGRPTEIGVTELNIDACDFQRAPVNSNQVAALWYADVLGRMAYNGVDFVTWYEGYGNGGQGFPAVFVEEDYYPTVETIYLRPIYYSMFLYGNFFGDRLVKTNGLDNPKISLYASKDSKNPNRLFLMAVNLSADYAKVQINISGFLADRGFLYELTNPDPLSRSEESNGIRHGSTINGYTLTAKNVIAAAKDIPRRSISISNGTASGTLAPYSVSALVLENGTGNSQPNKFYYPWIMKIACGNSCQTPALRFPGIHR